MSRRDESTSTGADEAVQLGRALRRVQPPDATGAQARAWDVVSSVYRERAPIARSRARRRASLAPVLAAMIALVVALTLTPAGATVSRLIAHAFTVPPASPTLPRLPAAGRLLVSGPGGTWVIAANGARRRLGPWRQATWSPHGRYLAIATREGLAVVNPRGAAQWALPRSSVSDPTWYAPSGFRVAYLAGRDLRAVAGDGTGDHLLAVDVAPVQAAWRPDHPYQIAYVTHGRVLVRNADTGALIWSRPAGGVRRLAWSADGSRLALLEPTGARVLTGTGRALATIHLSSGDRVTDASLSPDGGTLALVRGGVDPGVLLARLTSPRPALRSVLPGPGIQQVAWSPDSRWLLASWPLADQWVFIAVSGRPRITAASRIAQQLAGGRSAGTFPHLDGWCCTARGAGG